MHKAVYGIAMASLCLVVMLALPHAAWSGSPPPRPPIDSDGEPFCAGSGCHASVSKSHPPEGRAETAKNGAYTTKRYQVREQGVGEVMPVEPEQQFLEQARTIGGKAM